MIETIELRKPINSLVSYHYFKKVDIEEMHNWGLRLIGDSGAFSAFSKGVDISVKEFAEWGFKWKKNLAWIASLDVIGDQKKSYKNYKELRSLGLDVIPTIHYGAKPETLDIYASEGVDFVGLGGMVGRKSEKDKLLRWTLNIFRHAKKFHPNMRFHGWGVTHTTLINNLPWYSVDSSGFSSAYRYATLRLFDPRKGKSVGINLDGQDIFKHSELIRRVYNIDPELVKLSTPDTRRNLVRLSVASVQQLENFLQKRHGFISTPKYGITQGTDRTSVHLALGASGGGAQASMSLSPTDKPARNLDGPHIHFVDAARANLELGLGTKIHSATTSMFDIKAMGGQI